MFDAAENAMNMLDSAAQGDYFAQQTYKNENTGYQAFIYDGEDLLSDSEEAALLQDMIPITEFGNAAFESVYVRGQSSYDYAKANYTGYFKESGTLFLIDMGNREIKLYSSGKIEKTVTGSYANSITDNIYTYASKGDYYTCASKAFQQEATLLEGGRIAQPMKYISCGLLALILALIINYFIVRLKSKNTRSSQEKMMSAVAMTTAVAAASTAVTKRVRHTSSSGGSHGGGGGGGGGGGFSGGGHSF